MYLLGDTNVNKWLASCWPIGVRSYGTFDIKDLTGVGEEKHTSRGHHGLTSIDPNNLG